uniref:NUAK family kinase 2 n=1 Tax=Ovis aries TaxID=9940 RepID=A0AC11E9G2_SHEEP
MESLPFPRRLGPAPSATAALAAELVRPLADGLLKSPKPLMKKQAVKRHHHKHNLRHRYEFLETLGKGTYGKVKKARESSGRLGAEISRNGTCSLIHRSPCTSAGSLLRASSLLGEQLYTMLNSGFSKFWGGILFSTATPLLPLQCPP